MQEGSDSWESDCDSISLLTEVVSQLSDSPPKSSMCFWPPRPETKEEIKMLAEKVLIAEDKHLKAEAKMLPFEMANTYPLSQHELNNYLIEKETKEMEDKRIRQMEQIRKYRDEMSSDAPSIATHPADIKVPLYQTINVVGDYAVGVSVDDIQLVCRDIYRALSIREKYMRLSFQRFPPTASQFLRNVEGKRFDEEDEVYPTLMSYFNANVDPFRTDDLQQNLNYITTMKEGVVHVYADEDAVKKDSPIDLHYVNLETYFEDYSFVVSLFGQGAINTYATQRLDFHSFKYKLHIMLNGLSEMKEVKDSPPDFYSCRKVDTHIHAAACMSARHLLSFIKHTYKYEPDRVINSSKGTPITLKELFTKLNLTTADLNMDVLDVHAGHETFSRFDRFNSKYNPMGASELRELYLKVDNDIGGEYFATILKEVGDDLSTTKYVYTEPRLSIYGRTPEEWKNLAEWFTKYRVFSPYMKWMIQVPRIYNVFRTKNIVPTFGKYLENIFMPLFEATIRPQENKELSVLLRHITAFDSVDDESKHSGQVFSVKITKPQDWHATSNPPYSYYIYYMYANIAVLNQLRRQREMNTFLFRPHCGEAGAIVHLASGFLTSDSISHGLNLTKSPIMQYLYFLCQIYIAMSPLSNNSLFLRYGESPFKVFFEKGLKVTLSTDDPLLFHYTKEPLLEEYAIAAQLFGLNACDMCEIARNSVLQSGLSHEEKVQFVGDAYQKDGPQANVITKTNVSQIRMDYRYMTWCHEFDFMSDTMKLGNL